ncbi:hypothetical protein K458DRAFT_384300 [Lentithecium fluviatile CBS 122367]|uniref:Uncharacterized protein n=1 Tax=Lentithecium fluviatile CBS 122367 TaxID=1168545 RepID=A0A6G1JGU7_9PLEO|nr:hypothetical protein K458DRAFT_384300 [Lentithecium fluviatile CBS 122367]
MLFKTILLALQLSGTILAVDFYQYSQRGRDCSGPRRVCTDVGPNECCGPAQGIESFYAAQCRGCTSTDFSILWRESGGSRCGVSVLAGNGGGCLAGGIRKRGQSWCRLCGTRAAGELAEDVVGTGPNGTFPECEKEVEPDLASRDGATYYNISSGIPAEDRAAIEKWIDDEVTTASLDSKLEKYKVQYTPPTEE